MAKIKTLTSMNRNGVAVQNSSEIDIPDHEAVALCRNGLAQPIGWTLEEVAASEGDSESLVDPPPAPKKNSKKS